jgi:hypothetical protein
MPRVSAPQPDATPDAAVWRRGPREGPPRVIPNQLRDQRGLYVRCAAVPIMLIGLGCAPVLDWRIVRPPATHVESLFPCKPDSTQRVISIAGAEVPMSVYACGADDAIYALGFADVVDPARVGTALLALRDAAQAHLEPTSAAVSAPLHVPGMTPNAASAMWTLHGRAADGRDRQYQLALFAFGTHVYQATIVSKREDMEARGTFFGALRVTP